MEINKALWYLQDFTNTTINSDFIEAVNTVILEYKKLQNEIMMLKSDKSVERRISE